LETASCFEFPELCDAAPDEKFIEKAPLAVQYTTTEADKDM
jgi:hypothetical protein